MKAKPYLFTIFLAVIFISSACTDDFLDGKGIKGQPSEAEFYKSVRGLNLAVMSAYQNLGRAEAMEFIGLMFGSVASDDAECGGNSDVDGIDFQSIDRFTHDNSINISKKVWGYSYKGIYYTNILLKKAQDYIDNNAITDSTVYRYIGEGYFLRALYYFQLNQIYGGVPLITEPDNLDYYFEVKRSSISQTLNFIKSDLLRAEKLLLTRGETSSSNLGRATKEAAWGLLAKAYLFESSYAKNYSGDDRFTGCKMNYDSVAYYAEKVIASPSLYLVGLNGETYSTKYSNATSGFQYIFTVEGDNSPESVFEVQHMLDLTETWINNKGSYLNIYSTPRAIYPVNSTGKDSVQFGWGFNCPTLSLLNEFEEGDPRLKFTISKPGDSIWATYTNDNGVLQTYYAKIAFGFSPTKMYGRKYEVHPDHYWMLRNHPAQGPTNNKLMRLADIYLIAAEAYLETPNPGKALEYVNLIRQRARNSGNTGAPTNLTSVSFDDIVHERRVELALEGSRFFDLVRWKKAYEKINGTVVGRSPFTVSYEIGKHEFFPIHYDDILSTNGNVKQNDGY